MVTDPVQMPEPADTPREALRNQYAVLRRLTPTQRLKLADELTVLARGLTRSGIRRRHPELTESAIEVLFFERMLGKDLARRVLDHRTRRRDTAP